MAVDNDNLDASVAQILQAALKRAGDTGRVHGIKLSVVHANLAYARFPVVVGHHQGEALLHAEHELDQRLKGALSTRLQVGRYPAQPSSPLFLEAPGRRPKGALVLGLGPIEAFDTGQLKEAVRHGVLEALLRTPEDQTAGLSTLLVGASSLGEEHALRAILRGVLEAQDELLAERGRTLDELEIVELYGDRAQGLVQMLEGASLLNGRRSRFEVQTPVAPQVGEGGRAGSPQRRHTDEWPTRATIEGIEGGLRFSVLTDRAGAPVRDLPLWAPASEALIRTARGDDSPFRADLGRVLFRLFVERSWQDRLSQDQPLQLILDRTAAQIPWELMQDDGDEPPSCRAPVTRQLKDARYQARPLARGTLRVLLAGDFEAGELRLPGARAELEQLEARLSECAERTPSDERQLEVLEPIVGPDRDNALRLFEALSVWEPVGVHLAAHGLVREDGTSGVVLPGDGAREDRLLTGALLENQRQMPRLVVINCCWSGVVRGPEDVVGLAAGVAETLITAGTQAVVVAGWEVSDAGARQFSHTFWSLLLQGEPLGRAAQLARRRVWRTRLPGDDTWGAYQVYGDPGFRLVPGDTARTLRTRWDLLFALEEATKGAAGADLQALEDHLADGLPGHPDVPDAGEEGQIQVDAELALAFMNAWAKAHNAEDTRWWRVVAWASRAERLGASPRVALQEARHAYTQLRRMHREPLLPKHAAGWRVLVEPEVDRRLDALIEQGGPAVSKLHIVRGSARKEAAASALMTLHRSKDRGAALDLVRAHLSDALWDYERAADLAEGLRGHHPRGVAAMLAWLLGQDERARTLMHQTRGTLARIDDDQRGARIQLSVLEVEPLAWLVGLPLAAPLLQARLTEALHRDIARLEPDATALAERVAERARREVARLNDPHELARAFLDHVVTLGLDAHLRAEHLEPMATFWRFLQSATQALRPDTDGAGLIGHLAFELSDLAERVRTDGRDAFKGGGRAQAMASRA